jgi:hypothetical protein
VSKQAGYELRGECEELATIEHNCKLGENERKCWNKKEENEKRIFDENLTDRCKDAGETVGLR